MAEIVRRRSWGGVLPLGRHVSISGSSFIQCASASIAPPHPGGAKCYPGAEVQGRTGSRRCSSTVNGFAIRNLRVCPGTSCGIAEPSQHEADRGKAEEGERLAVEVLPILGQSTAAVQPRDGAFDYRLYNVARRRLRGCLNWALAGRSVAEYGTRSRHPPGQSRCVAQGREQSPVSQASQDRPALGRPSAQTLRDGRRPATARVVLRPLTERPEGAPGGEPRAP